MTVPNPEMIPRRKDWWCKLCRKSVNSNNVFRHMFSKRHNAARKALNKAHDDRHACKPAAKKRK